jgi:hypothetical protein
MNTYQIVLTINNDIVLAHIVANSSDRAIHLFHINYPLGFTIEHKVIILCENVTDKNGISLKEKIKIF